MAIAQTMPLGARSGLEARVNAPGGGGWSKSKSRNTDVKDLGASLTSRRRHGSRLFQHAVVLHDALYRIVHLALLGGELVLVLDEADGLSTGFVAASLSTARWGEQAKARQNK